jgi:hypothetical protein
VVVLGAGVMGGGAGFGFRVWGRTDYPLSTTYMLETISLSTQEKGTLYKGAGSITKMVQRLLSKKVGFLT